MPGPVVCEIRGADELVRALETAANRAKTALPQKAAFILAEHSRRAFREPALRPSQWAPLADSTLKAAGRTGKGVKEARAKAAAFSKKASDIAEASVGLSGKKLEKNLLAAARAHKKAKEWKAKAVEARTAAIANRQPLIRTGDMMNGIVSQGDKVTSAKDYAVFHQLGTRLMPARPFVPVKPDGSIAPKTERTMKAALEEELQRLFK